MRKIISLSLFISLFLVILSSVILYIVPEGRVAYWSDWTILGLSKSQWGDLHITTGLLFLVAGVWHTLLNWRQIVRYIQKGMAHTTGSMRPWPILVAVAIVLFTVIGTLRGWQPMKQLLVWNEQIKEYQANRNGNPPYGHAELSSLESFCGFLGLDQKQVLEGLKAEGMQGELTLKTTILEMAHANGSTPQQVYEKIQEIASERAVPTLPAVPPQGLGKMTFSQLCETYGMDLTSVIRDLEQQGIHASANETLKEVAEECGMKPMDLYQLLTKPTHP